MVEMLVDLAALGLLQGHWRAIALVEEFARMGRARWIGWEPQKARRRDCEGSLGSHRSNLGARVSKMLDPSGVVATMAETLAFVWSGLWQSDEATEMERRGVCEVAKSETPSAIVSGVGAIHLKLDPFFHFVVIFESVVRHQQATAQNSWCSAHKGSSIEEICGFGGGGSSCKPSCGTAIIAGLCMWD